VKILEMSFKLGIFENPYVDPAGAIEENRNEANMLAGFDAQKRALVLLRNPAAGNAARLPISQTRLSGGKIAADSNEDGKISVYFDGVKDSLAGDDQYSDFLGAYDYKAPLGAGALEIVEAASATEADIAVVRIAARKGTYFGLDAGVPLSFDAPLPSPSGANDGNLPNARRDRNRVIDLFRIRDGYTKADGSVVVALNPKLKIVLVVHVDRPTILKPFLNGLKTLDEVSGEAGSYPLVSDETNINPPTGTFAHPGVDSVVADFGAYDRAILDFVFGKNPITGVTYGAARLPVEFPSTDAAVDAQFEDVPFDSYLPTFTMGSGSNLPTN
jgi:beta-glucosidase